MSVRKNSSGGGLGIGGDYTSLATRSTIYYTGAEVQSTFYQTERAEVLFIDQGLVVPSNIGRIRFRFLSDAGRELTTLDWAYPLNPNIKSYPVLHESVAVIEIDGKFYYDAPMNYNNYVNNNATANISQTNIKLKASTKSNVTAYQKTQQSGIATNVTNDQKLKLGEEFKDLKLVIPALTVSEGDFILQGRFGNYIRFGSNSKTGTPVVKMSLIHKRETQFRLIDEVLDIDSCIWMTSDEVLQFKLPQTPLATKELPQEFNGKQIIITSNRIIVSSKADEVFIFSAKGIHAVANKGITIDTSTSVDVTAKKDITIKSSEGIVTLDAKTKTVIKSPEIFLGDTAKENLVLGKKLVALMEELLDAMMTETHIGFSGPPTPNVTSKYMSIKSKLQNILSNKNYTV